MHTHNTRRPRVLPSLTGYSLPFPNRIGWLVGANQSELPKPVTHVGKEKPNVTRAGLFVRIVKRMP